MDAFSSFLPMDRRQALANGYALPEQLQGAALFADLSGSSALTEELAAAYGPQRGAEELTQLLNRIYNVLTVEIDRYGGSVIGFSGDAILAWFDGADGHRAVTCALALQAAFVPVAGVPLPAARQVTLGLKVAVAAGAARRFLVGDRAIRMIEVLAGAVLDRLAAAERLARQGEVVLDPLTAACLRSRVRVAATRPGPRGAGPFVVVGGLARAAAPAPWPPLSPGALTPAQVRPWLLPAVHAWLASGQGDFLTELRPAVALFLRFAGLDYDHDAATGARLDAYIRWVQGILARYDGSLIQVTIGDKGSYLYAAFGAPLAHADDARRAVAAALELRAPPADLAYITGSAIGISGGLARTGTYGGSTRTYGVLGDAVNLGAGLMQAAAAGQVLLSGDLAGAVERSYTLHAVPRVPVKGPRATVPVLAVVGPRPTPAIRLQEPEYTHPLVGRAAELAHVAQLTARVLAGQGRILGLVAEAGMGKSRLVAEIIRRAMAAGMQGYGGAAQATGTRIAYLAWHAVWRAFFDLDPAAALDVQVAELEAAVAGVDPALRRRVPLLAPALGLSLPDNDLTRDMDAQLRKESLEALLVDCVKHRAQITPLLLVLEDAHWLDALSADLLGAIGRAIGALPVLVLLAYRPPDSTGGPALPVLALPYAGELRVGELSGAEVAELIADRLAAAGHPPALPAVLVDAITTRAAGNPFYIEELLNYLQDRGIALTDMANMDVMQLPDSLQSLILSRIDTLTVEQQTTLKVASIIGRVFPAAWLWRVHPDLGPVERVQADLRALAALDLTPLETPEPDPRYLFKHIITQEVTYASLPFALRARLHEQLATWLESSADAANPPLDLLAYHFGRSANTAKQHEYYRKAGDAAAARFANAAAVQYYENLLALLPAHEQGPVHVLLGDMQERLSAWDAAETHYRAALTLVGGVANAVHHAQASLGLGAVERARGAYSAAVIWLEQARREFADLGRQDGLSLVLIHLAIVYWVQGKLDQTQALVDEILALEETTGDKWRISRALHLLGNVDLSRGDYPMAREWWVRSLVLKRELGDKPGIAGSVTNMALAAFNEGQYTEARTLVTESLALYQELGSRREYGQARGVLARIHLAEGDFTTARSLFAANLILFRDLGARQEIVVSLIGLAAATEPAESRYAVRLIAAALALLAAIDSAIEPGDQLRADAVVAAAHARLGADGVREAWAQGQAMAWASAVDYALAPGDG